MWVTCLDINYLFLVAYHLPRIPGNSGWDANGKRVFGSSHWKIPGTTAEILGAFHLVKISGISDPAVNGTRCVGSSHWKILRKSGKSKKVGLFSRLEFPNGISCSIYTFLVVCTSSRSTARKSVTASQQIKMASLKLMYQCTVCFFAGPTKKALLHHECPGLVLIGKYLVMSNSNIYSEVHIHWLESLQFFCWHAFLVICYSDASSLDSSRSPSSHPILKLWHLTN